MTVSDFHAKARSEWIAKINMNVPAGDHSRTWTTPHSIAEVLQPFMGSSANHGHLPTGGGFDFLNISLSREPGCLEFGVSGSTFLLAKPRRLVLERIDLDAAQSFLMLELDDLDPSGVYDDATNMRLRDRRDEEVVDIGRGEYVARDGYDDGSFIDTAGHRRDLPEGSRLMVRLLGGQIMFVTKGSLWNGSPQTYRGLHDGLSIVEIRRMIENALNRSQ